MSQLGEDHVLEDAEEVKEPEVDTAGEEEVEEEAGDSLPFPAQKEEEEDEHVPTDDRQQQIDDGTLAGPVPSETVVRTELSAQEPPIRKPVGRTCNSWEMNEQWRGLMWRNGKTQREVKLIDLI